MLGRLASARTGHRRSADPAHGDRANFVDTRPGLMHYVGKRSDLVSTAEALFAAIREGILDANVNYEYPLKDAVAAHQALEGGTTLGGNRPTSVKVGKR